MNSIKLTAMTLGLIAAGAFAQTTPAPQTATQPAQQPEALPNPQPPAPPQATEVTAEKKGPEFKISGKAEFDAYGDLNMEDNNKFMHSYASTVDVDVNVKFNDSWSAFVEIEADGDLEKPSVYYNKAFVKYTINENTSFKFGDLTFSEGAFKFYKFDDQGVNAAGMREHDIRGLEFNYFGLQLGLGFGRHNNDAPCGKFTDCPEEIGKSYDAHAAYQFEIDGHTFRPYIHYKSWQNDKANELHTGLDANLALGPFDIHTVYGLHVDRLTKSNPNGTHAFLIEPALNLDGFQLKTGFFFAIFDDDLALATIHGDEIPEYKFAYGEADFTINDALTLGCVIEWHTNTIDSDRELGTLELGPRAYFSPVNNLDIKGFAKAILPLGDDWESLTHGQWVSTKDYGKELNLSFGVETVFKF
ncbi:MULTISPECIES: hypothetical protein [Fibrobacter]|uniref:hypothetical protein n=1 Tax=Fibrobacter TaxID=832 RepID=UPI000B51F4C2|nr:MULTISPECIES: hypothetical protein [Fibrobacter]OWV17722.1 hypothetical protein B7990_09545 [Fibrobacter sp. UWB4]